jgi:hypothetical protein
MMYCTGGISSKNVLWYRTDNVACSTCRLSKHLVVPIVLGRLKRIVSPLADLFQIVLPAMNEIRGIPFLRNTLRDFEAECIDPTNNSILYRPFVEYRQV